jgi:hypothetical protein
MLTYRRTHDWLKGTFNTIRRFADAGGELYDAADMNGEAIQRATLVTLRRATCARPPPGTERDAWLCWLARLANCDGWSSLPLRKVLHSSPG